MIMSSRGATSTLSSMPFSSWSWMASLEHGTPCHRRPYDPVQLGASCPQLELCGVSTSFPTQPVQVPALTKYVLCSLDKRHKHMMKAPYVHWICQIQLSRLLKIRKQAVKQACCTGKQVTPHTFNPLIVNAPSCDERTPTRSTMRYHKHPNQGILQSMIAPETIALGACHEGFCHRGSLVVGRSLEENTHPREAIDASVYDKTPSEKKV
ncbi:hypothetical protein DPMN_148690 [Dreissena polymorpha]|uniref:Uncharacterized protein n=1 Tax=Dreissena polymorpha TaxID=45954 RepID=A0A9D4FAF1_DREPO|nr:hypothetical protein DPMN_148690 [Dreissena polymorpha]